MVDIPTAAALKTRHPEFAPVSDARVDLFIAEAVRSVDSSWIEADQSQAIISLACHRMSLEGEPGASGNGGVVGNLTNGKFLKRRTVGDVTNEYAESASATSESTASRAGYKTTAYGANFLRLMTLNHSGMRVV